MKRERKILVYIATSADGFIARKDGSYDWLDRPSPPGHYGYAKFMRSIDTILWGRTTYDQALGMGGLGVFGAKTKNYVFTHHPPKQPVPGVEFVNKPVKTFVDRLRADRGKDIWMMGGGKVIASFLDVGAIDEFLIHVIPVMIGEGIPLVSPRHRNIDLRVRSVKKFSDGVVRLHYVVGPLARRPKKRHR